MDLTSRRNTSRSSALAASGQGAVPPSDQQPAQIGEKRSDAAKNDSEVPNMPGMPGDGVSQFFAAMLDKRQNADDKGGAASSGQMLGPVDMRPLGAASDEEKDEGGGPRRFLRELFFGGGQEQKPDKGFLQSVGSSLGQRGQAPAASGGGPPQAGAGLFAAMDAPLRGLTSDDIQFASEVDAALSRRPRFGVRALSVTVAAMLLLLIIWAAFADIDEVTHAEGQVVGSQRTQTIQNLEGGILRAVLVREGQIVEKGDILAQLDN
ncbi:MAG: biotin/lipoyl-binding protein, partial [Desulfovibrio sp.]|nr:biotin/lipoyl-binding protein [Desulfovibrio sp.]